VLFTTAPGAEPKALQVWAKANGIAELAVPKQIVPLDALPVLGTGKIDYVTLGSMALQSDAGTGADDADDDDALAA
jgi:acyl-[acyl-carrier-protein]-phospholipid O-acyltransferase / long-chain-fatty-acid--[acyl-carrier-protein] ligase